jgi:hypothetical protein
MNFCFMGNFEIVLKKAEKDFRHEAPRGYDGGRKRSGAEGENAGYS